MRVSHLFKGDSPMTVDLAMRMGQALQYSLNLQTAYDLKVAAVATNDSLSAVRDLTVVRSLCTGSEPLDVHGYEEKNRPFHHSDPTGW